jgi:hypothetical protein
MMWFLFFISPMIMLCAIFIPVLRGIAMAIIVGYLLVALFGTFVALHPDAATGALANMFLFVVYVAVFMIYSAVNIALFVFGQPTIPWSEFWDLVYFLPVFN